MSKTIFFVSAFITNIHKNDKSIENYICVILKGYFKSTTAYRLLRITPLVSMLYDL